jgi:hypothetical protein
MGALVVLGRALFGGLGLCAMAGAIVGSLAGYFFGIVLLHVAPIGPTPQERGVAALVLAVFGWINVLVLIGWWLGYGIKNIALPALINAVLVSFLTVFIVNALGLPGWGMLLGFIIGIVVGTLLCQWCRMRRQLERPDEPRASSHA